MLEEHTAEARVVVRVPVVSPDNGAAWRALYEGEPPAAEPVEDEELPPS